MQLLRGNNYPTWSIQCRMVLIRDGVWGIVSGTETAPTEADKLLKFQTRSDKALATIVLAIDPALLYLLGDPVDPVAVWKTLQNQFQKKTWANKLALRRRLNSLTLQDGSSVTDHIKSMIEVFSELAVIGAPMEDEDKVVTLLASLPESYNVLVTALEASAEVPKMDVVTERLLHEERKVQDREKGAKSDESLLMMKSTEKHHQRGPRCYGCSELGHIWRDCPEENSRNCASQKEKFKYRGNNMTQRAHKVEARWTSDSSSDEGAVLIAENVLSSIFEPRSKWIVDSGATCHMSHDRELFQEYSVLEKHVPVALGDGKKLEAIGKGVIRIKVQGRSAKSTKLALHDVLHVPGLSYNLISVSKAAEYGKTVVFKDQRCKITDSHGNTLACADRVGGLYRVRCVAEHRANIVDVEGIG